MVINIEITKDDLRKMIVDFIQSKFDHPIKENNINILVKSKQIYKSEWEIADFKAEYKE